MGTDTERFFASIGQLSAQADVVAKVTTLAESETWDTLDPFRRAVEQYAVVRLGKTSDEASRYADEVMNRVTDNLKASGHRWQPKS